MNPITLQQMIVFHLCCTCGIPIAMTESQQRQYNENGMTITCVLGHGTVRRESDNLRLQRELRETQDKLASAETRQRTAMLTLDAEIKKRQRLERRVKAGVCPHCQRTFQNVARHMKSQHS